MNLLDAIHVFLNQHGPADRDVIEAAVIDPKIINPFKVIEDLNRLKTAGRVTVTKQGEWSVV